MRPNLLILSSQYPYSLDEIRPIYKQCQVVYDPLDKAVEKCREIIETALLMNIGLHESYRMQIAIDLLIRPSLH